MQRPAVERAAVHLHEGCLHEVLGSRLDYGAGAVGDGPAEHEDWGPVLRYDPLVPDPPGGKFAGKPHVGERDGEVVAKGYEVHGLKRRASSFNTDRLDHIY